MINITKEQFLKLNYATDIIEIICDICGKTYTNTKYQFMNNNRRSQKCKSVYDWVWPPPRKNICCEQCKIKLRQTGKIYKCQNCNNEIYKSPASRKASKNCFCSQSCAALYNNAHKTHGYRRSKLELYIEEQLKKEFPQIDFIFNDKTTILSELDIYIPALKLAIELNGIFHYEPIYSDNQFTRIQNNDKQKIMRCNELGIELAIIDTSKLVYFKPQNAQKYYLIVKSLIQQNIQRLKNLSN